MHAMPQPGSIPLQQPASSLPPARTSSDFASSAASWGVDELACSMTASTSLPRSSTSCDISFVERVSAAAADAIHRRSKHGMWAAQTI